MCQSVGLHCSLVLTILFLESPTSRTDGFESPTMRADVRRTGLEAGIVILTVLLFAAIVIIIILTVLSVILTSKIKLKNGFNPVLTHNPNTLGEYTSSRYCNIHSLSVYYRKYIILGCFMMTYVYIVSISVHIYGYAY